MNGRELTDWMIKNYFQRWKASPEQINQWRRAMEKALMKTDQETIQGAIGEHWRERGDLPDPVLREVEQKIAAKLHQPHKSKAISIPLGDRQEQERRRQQQFQPLQSERAAQEKLLRHLPPAEFQRLKVAALASIEAKWPVTRAVIAKISGDDPFRSPILFGVMISQMGAAAK